MIFSPLCSDLNGEPAHAYEDGSDVDGVNQHGFRSFHSTTTAALEVQDVVAGALDSQQLALVYSVDLSVAFDIVRPGIFVEKALRVIKEPGLVWLIHEYITERRAFVEIGNSVLTTFGLEVGCPQGSTLGPKVFNIYCHDLVKVINQGQLISYADDSYVIVTSGDLQQVHTKACKQMVKHVEWLKTNGMVCNIEKSQVIVLETEETIDLECSVV